MKLYTLTLTFALSITTGSALAAPLCSQVLQSRGNLTASAIEQTIQSIAELRYQLDIAQSQGPLSTSNKSVKSEYIVKLKELIESLKGKLSEQEIHNLIAQKIAEIQKANERNREQEKKTKENQKRIFNPSLYKMESAYPFNLAHLGNRIQILPDGHRFLFRGADSLRIFDFERETAVSLNLNAKLFETDGTQIIGVSVQDNALYTYDIPSATVSKEIPLNVKPGTQWQSLDLTPSKNLALLKGSISGNLFTASIYNLKTGEEIFNQDKFRVITNPSIHSVPDLRILDDKYLLAVVNSKFLQRIEIATGKVEESMPFEVGPSGSNYQIALSPDRSIGTLFVTGLIMSFDPYHFSKPDSVKIESDITTTFDDRIHEISDAALKLNIAFGIRSHAGATLIDMNTLSESFNFENRYLHSNQTYRAEAATISADRRKILILNRNLSGQAYIDTWTLLPLEGL
jgi:hypothetical protein